MEHIQLVVGIIFVGLLFLFFIFKDAILDFLKSDENKLPYEKKDFLLNIPERKFFEMLQDALSGKYVIFPQIVLSNIISVTAKGKEFWEYQNKINKKTIDFVIFSKPNLSPLLAIEYDGKTHKEKSRHERDEFVDSALNSAGIKCIHVPHNQSMDYSVIKANITQLLNEQNY